MDELPNIKVDDHLLNRDQVVSLLSILQKLGPRLHWKATDYLKPPKEPIWTELRQKFDPEQLNEFLLAVFEMWNQNASLRKDFWAILTLGIWGNDFTARKLAILTGSWLRRSGTKRSVNDFIPKSVAALMVLGFIGTPTAISFIRNWATRQKPGGLFQFVDLAQSLSKYLARQKQVSLFELDLQNVPDCGFDQEGVRDFDFGSRQFRVTSNEAFEPLIFNGSGEELKDFPTQDAKENPQLADRAIREWALVRTQLNLIASTLPSRLENAMCQRETGRADLLECYLLNHPILNGFARRLVWGAFSETGEYLGSFRISEDDTFRDQTDRSFNLPPQALIGPIHPVRWTEEEHLNWNEIFKKHRLKQPFPQLKRFVARLSPEELAGTRMTQLNGIQIKNPFMNSAFSNLNWLCLHNRGENSSPVHVKHFEWTGLWAVVRYDTVDNNEVEPGSRTFLIHQVYFLNCIPGSDDKPLPLTSVDPILNSEVLADLNSIASKEKKKRRQAKKHFPEGS